MFLFKPFSHSPRNNLIIFIGTGNIGALVYRLQGGGRPPFIVDVVIRPHVISPVVDLQKLAHFAKREFKEISDIIAKKYATSLGDIRVVCSSPWYFPRLRMVHIKRERQFEMTHSLLEDIINEEKKIFLQYVRDKFLLSEHEYKITDFVPMKVVMNGYGVEHFIGKKAEEAIIYFYMSASTKSFLESIRSLAEESFHTERITFHSVPLVLLNMLNHFWNIEQNSHMPIVEEGAILIDIGGEITDVALLRKGIIEELFSFGKGTHFVIRRIASALRSGQNEALSLFNTWKRKELTDNRAQRIDNIVKEAVGEWAQLFEKGLRDASKDFLAPWRVIMVGEGCDMPYLQDALQEQHLKDHISSNCHFQIETITAKTLRPLFEGTAQQFASGAESVSLYAGTLI